ncbi:MAG: hypothetical protein ABMB14_19465 [Myxococcota bacterium]
MNVGILVAAWVLAACGGASPQVALDDATARLAASDWDGARTVADTALAANRGDPSLRWRLELVRLEAVARGRPVDAKQAIERLATEYPSQVDPARYASTAEQVHLAGDKDDAIAILNAGLRRYPTDAALRTALDTLTAPPPPPPLPPPDPALTVDALSAAHPDNVGKTVTVTGFLQGTRSSNAHLSATVFQDADLAAGSVKCLLDPATSADVSAMPAKSPVTMTGTVAADKDHDKVKLDGCSIAPNTH